MADLNKLSDKIGAEHQKLATIEASSLDLSGLSDGQFQNAKDLLIQLVRNSMVHGIETPEVREDKMKWAEGSIRIRTTIDESSDNILGVPCCTIDYRDDGKGLDPEEIGKRAVELEMISEEELESMNNQELSAFIFQHGFSSIDVSDDHAGRGTGMELIRSIVHKKMGGKLRMTYQTGDYLDFAISFPMAEVEASADQVEPQPELQSV